jgi:hypothetical protein
VNIEIRFLKKSDFLIRHFYRQCEFRKKSRFSRSHAPAWERENVNILFISFLDADILIKQHCIWETNIKSSRFFIKGRGGLPDAIDDLQSDFSHDELLVD